MPQLKIHHIHRDTLIEGRTSGISFAFAKKVSDDKYEEVMVLSPCKDYINDATWAEMVNKTSPKVHGFTHTPSGILNDSHVYLSTAVCFNNHYENPERYEVAKHLPLIHEMEKALGFEPTEHIPAEPYDVLKIDKRWASQPYMTSAYGLFFRNGNLYDPAKGIEGFFNKNKHRFAARTKENWDFIVANGIPNQDLTMSIHQIHSKGFQTLNVSLCKFDDKNKKAKAVLLPFKAILSLSAYGLAAGKDTAKLSDKAILDIPGIGPAYLSKIREYEKHAAN